MYLSNQLSSTYLTFFFTATAPTEIYSLSLHDALPISNDVVRLGRDLAQELGARVLHRVLQLDLAHDRHPVVGDRKSTRLNSSHRCISYAVFCLKKKN